MELATICFTLVFVLFAGYAVLDGFDLGVGSLHFLWRDEADRRRAINAILPVWDGHVLWLLAAGAVLFVAFPPVFAAVLGAFWLVLSLVLVAFVARGIAIESAVQANSPARRRAANWVFNVTSVLPPLLLGVALGNVMRGLPINAAGTYEGTVVALLNPYALLIGLLTLVLFALNGALYLEGRSAGPMRQRLQRWIMPLWCAFAVLHLFAAAATAWWSADLYSGITARPLFWVLTILWLAGLVSVPALVLMKKFTFAAVGSAGTVAAMVGLVGVALFPRLVPSSGSGISMTLENTAAAPSVLRTTLVMGLILLALIMAATAYVYRSTWRNAPATSNPY